MDKEQLKQAALDYHKKPVPGKIEIQATKPVSNQRELSLAYSPGVAAACDSIVLDPNEVTNLTGRQNLVAVITNGSAVLGLGNIGALASKPVMEGKAVLFKKFAGIDVFDLELNEPNSEKLIDIICALEPTFGAINIEDIKAPECFLIEKACQERMNIPVFHDDQHGTAIVTCAAVLNWLRLTGKAFEKIKIVSTGGGAAGIACLTLLVDMGVKKENIFLYDHIGMVFSGRKMDMNAHKALFAQNTNPLAFEDAIENADVFLGLSAANILSGSLVKKMADRPLILALANPDPEILPSKAKKAKPDAIIATGRSDYPNQVNNVLCFPFIFRGALDVGATEINKEMKIAAVKAIADLATIESSEVVAKAYTGQSLKFGPEYLIPKPFDTRLISEIAPAVAKAAMDSKIANNPIKNFEAYTEKLRTHSLRSNMLMKPIIERAQRKPKDLVFAEGEDERILRASQLVIDENIARPILIGRPDVINSRIKKLGLRIRVNEHFLITNPESDPRYDSYWLSYYKLMERRGISPDLAKTIIRTNTTAIAAMMLKRGEVDAMICGTHGDYPWHLKHIIDIIGVTSGVSELSAMATLIFETGTFFLCDTHITDDPNVNQIVESASLSIKAVQNLGITPKVALLSHSNFGSHDSPGAQKMKESAKILRQNSPNIEIEGELQADAALDELIREKIFPNSQLKGTPNLLIFPNLDSANIAFNLLKTLGEALSVGPILLGSAQPVHILNPSVTSQGIFNMSALAIVDAQARHSSPQLF